jgi:hypothetical protein
VGPKPELKEQIISPLHSSPIEGHFGVPVTHRRVKQSFYWPGIKADIHQCCQVCIQAKANRASYPRKLQPLTVPAEAWEIISMDFVEGLPPSANANCILVVVDKFTKFGHFIPLAHPYTTHSTATTFFSTMYILHGLSASIISDRDSIFTSSFWHNLFMLTGTSLRMSSSYHPQSDGQTERINQCLETYSCFFTHACPKK